MNRLSLLALALIAAAPAAAQQPPGPERFAVQPRSPEELWDAADYLVRSGQARLAVPYLQKLLDAEPSDDLLVNLRDRYGLGSFLRLEDDPATRETGRALLARLAAASRNTAARPERIRAAIAQLTRSREERDLGVDRLRQAGAAAVPELLAVVADPDRPLEERSAVLAAMGRLDAPAVPPLVAALDAPNAGLAAAVAEVLGRLGDRRALPALTARAARADTPAGVAEAARAAVARLTGRAFSAQPRTPTRLLADLAWQYHRGQVPFPADSVELWSWRDGNLASESVPTPEAATRLGLDAARHALAIDPADVPAQEALLSLALAAAARRHGVEAVAASDPDGVFAEALAAGPAVLADVLRSAIADGQGPLAELAAAALGRVTNRDAVGADPTGASGRGPLVAALDAPDRRVQLAAARALVALDPRQPFAGSSRVIPTLARFLDARPLPVALAVDGNASRANDYAAVLKALGFDPRTASDGREAFRLASETADCEVILIDPTALATRDGWSWADLIKNLRADARTASIPVVVVGPLRLRDRLGSRLLEMDRVGFLVAPSPDNPQEFRPLLDRELARLGARPLSADERRAYAREAAALLARLAGRPASPLAANLDAAEQGLSIALANPETRADALIALAEIPGAEAQRRLADVLLDPGLPPDDRRRAGDQLVRSVQRFGPLLTANQERRLADAVASADPALRAAFAAVVGTLRPAPSASGSRLRAFQTSSAPTTTPASRPDVPR
jgi:hypothetical protein